MPPSEENRDAPLYLVLSILEGHGFGFLQNPLVIVASACGISLDTETVPPSPDPIFHIDLVWETKKKSLRRHLLHSSYLKGIKGAICYNASLSLLVYFSRFRASNTPIKIECFTVLSNKKKDCIGSVLLNIRSAQMVSNCADSKVSERWHKLIGVPSEGKALQPELLLSLKIQESVSMSPHHHLHSQFKQDLRSEQPIAPRKISGGVNETIKQKTSVVHPIETVFVPVNDLEQYIQIGSDSSSFDLFLLTLNVGDIFGLQMLLPDSGPELSNGSEGFQIDFMFMNQCFTTRVFHGFDIDKVFRINEAIIIRLRTSLTSLDSYLHENPSVPMRLFWGKEEVAAAELHLKSLVPTCDIQSFSYEFGGENSCSQRCLCVSTRSQSIPVLNSTQPFIEVLSKLQLINNATPQKVTSVTINEAPPEISLQGQDCGECFLSRSESRHSQDTFILAAQSGPKWIPVVSNPIKTPSFVHSRVPCGEIMSSNHRSGKNMWSVTIKFHRLDLKIHPQSHHLRLMFECERKPILTSDSSDIFVEDDLAPVILRGICAKVVLSSPLNKLNDNVDVILSEVDSNPTVCHSFALGHIKLNQINISRKEEFHLTIPLQHVGSQQDVGMLHGVLTVENLKYLCLEESSIEDNILQSETAPLDMQPIQDLPFKQGLPSKKNVKFFSVQNQELENMVNAVNSSNVTGTSHALANELKIVSSVSQFSNEASALAPVTSLSQTTPLDIPVISSCAQTVTFPPFLTSSTVPSIPFDSAMAYRIVEELEDWKEKQQELFQAELKRKENDHLHQVSGELTMKKRELESMFVSKIEECKTLLQSLSIAKEDLKSRLKKCHQREQELQKEKEELEHQYNSKFQELTLTAKKLGEGAKLKASLAEFKCSQLEEQLSALKAENDNLKTQIYGGKGTLHPHGNSHTCGMSHNQVTKLLSQVNKLEEKLHSSLQSKAYFKEKWGRAVREMNQARSQFCQSSETFGEEKINILLGKEEAELQHDKEELEELRKELAGYNCDQTSVI